MCTGFPRWLFSPVPSLSCSHLAFSGPWATPSFQFCPSNSPRCGPQSPRTVWEPESTPHLSSHREARTCLPHPLPPAPAPGTERLCHPSRRAAGPPLSGPFTAFSAQPGKLRTRAGHCRLQWERCCLHSSESLSRIPSHAAALQGRG